jgi:hypothetical protein
MSQGVFTFLIIICLYIWGINYLLPPLQQLLLMLVRVLLNLSIADNPRVAESILSIGGVCSFQGRFVCISV